MGRVSLGCHGLSPGGKKGRRDRDVGDTREQVIGGSSRCMGRPTRMPRQPRTENNRFVHPDTLVCRHAATSLTRTHARTRAQNLTESSTSTRLTRASTRTQTIAPRARARPLRKRVHGHSAVTTIVKMGTGYRVAVNTAGHRIRPVQVTHTASVRLVLSQSSHANRPSRYIRSDQTW